MAGFDVNRSRIGQDKLSEFLAAPLPDKLIDVPGIGKATVTSLANFDIYNPRQLLGCFLRVCGEGMNSEQRCNAFWFYLKAMGVPGGTRSTIVHAIAEKVNIMIPGTYEEEATDNEEEEDDDGTGRYIEEFMIPDISTSMEQTYLELMNEHIEDISSVQFHVYDTGSFKLIKHLTRDGVLSKFVIDKKGFIYYIGGGEDDGDETALVVSETVLLNHCYDKQISVPQFNTINIIN